MVAIQSKIEVDNSSEMYTEKDRGKSEKREKSNAGLSFGDKHIKGNPLESGQRNISPSVLFSMDKVFLNVETTNFPSIGRKAVAAMKALIPTPMNEIYYYWK